MRLCTLEVGASLIWGAPPTPPQALLILLGPLPPLASHHTPSPRDVSSAGIFLLPSSLFPWPGLPHQPFSGQPQSSLLFPALSHPSILWSSCFLSPDPFSSCGFGELLPPTDSPSLLACHFPKSSRTLLVLSSTDRAPVLFQDTLVAAFSVSVSQKHVTLRVLTGSGCFYLSLPLHGTNHPTTGHRRASVPNFIP